jgi:hypothetical protein
MQKFDFHRGQRAIRTPATQQVEPFLRELRYATLSAQYSKIAPRVSRRAMATASSESLPQPVGDTCTKAVGSAIRVTRLLSSQGAASRMNCQSMSVLGWLSCAAGLLPREQRPADSVSCTSP